jgi:hypothetical protein
MRFEGSGNSVYDTLPGTKRRSATKFLTIVAAVSGILMAGEADVRASKNAGTSRAESR